MDQGRSQGGDCLEGLFPVSSKQPTERKSRQSILSAASALRRFCPGMSTVCLQESRGVSGDGHPLCPLFLYIFPPTFFSVFLVTMSHSTSPVGGSWVARAVESKQRGGLGKIKEGMKGRSGARYKVGEEQKREGQFCLESLVGSTVQKDSLHAYRLILQRRLEPSGPHGKDCLSSFSFLLVLYTSPFFFPCVVGSVAASFAGDSLAQNLAGWLLVRRGTQMGKVTLLR
mmetsp:Transcript_21589/g.42916  ORF Transcript_21589/g.42916 Transcript_21589/m.42916 type:complete len:228 (+) Transcript_21589:174-857(+)